MSKEYEMEYTREDELLERIERLEEENAKLKSELNRVSLNEQLAVNNGKCFLKQIAVLEKENTELKAKVEKSMDCETCKYYASVDENLEPCNSCFFDNSKWEIKENDRRNIQPNITGWFL